MTLNGSVYRDIRIRQEMDDIIRQLDIGDGFEMNVTEGRMLCFIDMIALSANTAEIRAQMDAVDGIEVQKIEDRACTGNGYDVSDLPEMTGTADGAFLWPEQAVLRRETQQNDEMFVRDATELVYRMHRYEQGASGCTQMRLLNIHDSGDAAIPQDAIQLALHTLMTAFARQMHCSERDVQLVDVRLSGEDHFRMRVRSVANEVLDAIVTGGDRILSWEPAVPEEGRKIRWLHFADLHMNKYGVETKRMRRELNKLLTEEVGPCDYVFFAGDLRYANGMKTDSYSSDVIPFLKDICNAAGVTADRLFVVPGNHDVYRDESRRMEAIKKIYPSRDYTEDGHYSEGYYMFDDGSIEETDRMDLAAGQEQFRSLMQKLYADVPGRAELYLDRTHPHFVVTTEDMNIVHLDTTLVYSENQQRELLVGTELLQQVLDQMNPEKPAIILTHYSYDFLHRDEQEEVLRQLIEHQVRIWLAGHEHNILARSQRDYFYDLQCGNLYAEKGSRSSVMVGELNPVTGEGQVRAYVWHHGEGWELYHGLKPARREKSARSVYELHLHTPEERESSDAKNSTGNDWAETTKAQRMENVAVARDYQDQGNNRDRDKSAWLWADAGIDENCVYAGKMYLYIGHELASLELLDVYIKEEQGIVHRFLCGDGYFLRIHSLGEQLTWIDCGYQLSGIKDVDKRLLCFQKIQKLVEADSIRLRPEGYSDKDENYLMLAESERIRKLREITGEWIDQMQRLAKIEQYFQIKFSLPVKPTEEEFQAIYLLSDSVDHIACYILPPFPAKANELAEGNTIHFDEEIQLGKPERIAPLDLFDYHFVPVNGYLPKCQLIWNEEKSGWETQEGGVPLGVDFQVE